MFKALRVIVILIAAVLCMGGCDNRFSDTPDGDTTMLWPAGDSTGYWGFINEKGEMVIPAKYDRTYGFSGGMAQVYIDVDGKPLLNFGYEVCVIGPKHAFINQRGEVLFSLPEGQGFLDHYFYYGCCRYCSMQTLGMMDTHFNAIIPDEKYYSDIRLQVMTKDGLASSVLGYFNKAGELVISAYLNGKDGNAYDDCYDFCDGVAVVYDDGWYMDSAGMCTANYRYGAINTKGEMVIDTVYTYLQSVGCNRLVYRPKGGDDMLFGLMDTHGNIITEPCIHSYGYSFFGDGGLMPVASYPNGRTWGYMDVNGTMQIPYKYAEALPFCNGYAWVRVQDEGFKLINMRDEVVLSLGKGQIPYFDNNFRNGLCLITYGDLFQYINMKGEVIYSWPRCPNPQDNNAPEMHETDSYEMMLRLFDGTPYYHLAEEQCVRNKEVHKNKQ